MEVLAAVAGDEKGTRTIREKGCQTRWDERQPFVPSRRRSRQNEDAKGQPNQSEQPRLMLLIKKTRTLPTSPSNLAFLDYCDRPSKASYKSFQNRPARTTRAFPEHQFIQLCP